LILFYKIRCLKEEINCTEPSSSIRVPLFEDRERGGDTLPDTTQSKNKIQKFFRFFILEFVQIFFAPVSITTTKHNSATFPRRLSRNTRFVEKNSIYSKTITFRYSKDLVTVSKRKHITKLNRIHPKKRKKLKLSRCLQAHRTNKKL
jgi:hypothetical protein